jgi:hypothetical protein
LSAKPPVKPALKTPSSSLASMSKRRMSRTLPRREIGILASLLLESLELLRLGASNGVGYATGRRDGFRSDTQGYEFGCHYLSHFISNSDTNTKQIFRFRIRIRILTRFMA